MRLVKKPQAKKKASKKASKKKASSKKRAKPKANWEKLQDVMKGVSYIDKAKIIHQLAQQDVTTAVSMVIAAARRNFVPVVYVPGQKKYTIKPKGGEIVQDLQRRRGAAYSWLLNCRAVMMYADSNWKLVTKGMSRDEVKHLRDSMDAITAATKYMERAFKVLNS
jgi:hypothetical protein